MELHLVVTSIKIYASIVDFIAAVLSTFGKTSVTPQIEQAERFPDSKQLSREIERHSLVAINESTSTSSSSPARSNIDVPSIWNQDVRTLRLTGARLGSCWAASDSYLNLAH